MTILVNRRTGNDSDSTPYAYHARGEGTGKFMTRMNAGFKLWINGEFITSVGVSHNTTLAIQWLAGDNEIVVAIDTLNGKVITMGMHAVEDVK